MIYFALAFLIAYVLSPVVLYVAKKTGLVDDPKKRYHPAHTHEGIIPRAGGIAIYAAILIPSLVLLEPSKPLLGILLGGALVVLVGIWDDYRDLSPLLRLGLNILCAAVVVGLGGGIPYLSNPFGGTLHLDVWRISFEFFGSHSIVVFSSIAAIIWIVWMMNAIGWSAGVDGQLPGFVVIACFVIAILANKFVSYDISQTVLVYLSLITAGAFAGFLPWNFYPQKIMPGYGGKSLAGFMLACLAIVSFVKVGTAILVLGVPLIDACYTIVRRILSRKSPFKADRGHLHHHLLDLGWGRRRIAFFYWAITAVLGTVALSLDSGGKLAAFLVVGGIIVGVLIFFQLLNFFRVLR
jgi:UDP-GlcNAc:undecaprenyl-phosphate GlcNAc-1-phosphate transferase